MPAVGVFCASSRTVEQRWLELARQVGTEFGRRGYTLVSGGGCVGMMGAVTAAARAAGAHTIGVIPQLLIDLEVADHDSDELVVTADMAGRKTVIMDRSDAFLVLPGGIGTLDELFEVWTTGTLGLHDKPVVLLDTDGFYEGLRAWLRTLVPAQFVRAQALDLLTVVDSVPAAFDAVEKDIA